MIIDFALLFEHSTGQPCILYGTTICSYCSKRTGGQLQISLLGLALIGS
jgi:hypothetical protein